MGIAKLLVIASAFFAIIVSILWYQISTPAQVPELSNQWFGPGKPHKVDESIRPFKINVSEQVLANLKQKLNSVPKLTPPLEGIGFEYGFNSDYLQEIVKFWKTKYNWREREVFLNKFPHFKTKVDGLDIHFIRVKPESVPKNTRVLPLLLLHGWPGSVREFYEIIPLLTAPRENADFVFEVVAPSLPGFGFSDAAAKPGMGPAQIAVIMKTLMDRIGFSEFYIQAGDWGAIVGTDIATFYPESVKGIHLNMCLSWSLKSMLRNALFSFWPTLVIEEEYVDRAYPLSKGLAFTLEESGYFHLQATKPDTIGVALQDSPVGFAAYILEKWSGITNRSWKSLRDGGLTKKFSLTQLLDNIMIYWVTGTAGTAVRIYSEAFAKHQRDLDLDNVPCYVPTACAMFPNEIAYYPEPVLKDKYVNLVRYTHMKEGGHFAAFENPDVLSEDVWNFVSDLQKSSTKYH